MKTLVPGRPLATPADHPLYSTVGRDHFRDTKDLRSAWAFPQLLTPHADRSLLNPSLSCSPCSPARDLIPLSTSNPALLPPPVQDYIVKPFSADELRARVRNQVNAKRAADILRAELSSSQHDLEALARELSAKSRQLQTAFTGMRIARDEAIQATRAKSDLLGLVSHELRTPLTGIELQIAMLEHRRADPLTDRQRQALDALKSANVRLRRLIEMILEYSRKENGRIDVSIEEFDLAILTKEILRKSAGTQWKRGLR